MAAQTLTSDSILPALVGLVELAAWRLRAFEGAPPASEAADQYRHDPANPVPTISGPCAVMPCTCRRVHEINVRLNHAMTFSYTLRAFTQDVEVTGPVTLELFVKSSAVDTDFTAKLVDVWPSGFAQNLTEGIVRARYRDSQAIPELINPGQIYKVTVDLWSTSNVFHQAIVCAWKSAAATFHASTET